jgi:hypothetical protein
VRVPQHRSRWVHALEGTLEKLTSLPRRWDGYAGQPVSFRVAFFAANLLERICDDDLPPPSLVPGSDGSLQIEWHCYGYDVEIDVRAPLDVHCFRYRLETGEEEEIQLTTDFTRLQKWVQDMSDAKAVYENAG